MGTVVWSQASILIFYVCAIGCLLIFPFVSAHSEQIQTSKGYLFHADDVPFSIDYHLHVAMGGFNGDGARRILLESDDLQQSLKHSLPSDRPACVQTGRLLHIQNNVNYDVFHVSTSHMEEMEKVIAANMVRAKNSRGEPLFLTPPPPPSATFRRDDEEVELRVALPVYDVELSKVDKQLAKILEQALENHLQTSSLSSVQPSKENAMLILNPDKNRIHAHMPDKPKQPQFLYRYRLGSAPASRAWVGFGRYVMVDLSAMSQTYGVTQAGKGTVSHTTIPDVQTQLDYKYSSTHMTQEELLASYSGSDGTQQPSVKFMSRLSTMVTSAVRKVFLSDVRFKSLDASERVVVPIVTLTNHDVTNPAASGFQLNVNRITKVVKKLLLPSQELLVTQISHSLYSHPTLAESVFRALTESTTHVMGKDGKYAAETLAYLDSEVLVAELLQSAQSNALLSSIVQASKLSQSRGEQMQQEHNKLAVQAIVNAAKQQRKHSAGHANNRYSRDIDVTEVYHEGVLKQRIVPVFVFSIVGLPPAALIDKGALAVPVAGGTMVIALQTPSANIPTPLFSSSTGKLTLDARDPTRDIIAALATALGGVMPPHEEYDVTTRRLETDYTWAMGLHPFAQFSGSYKLSKLYRDVAKRNGIATRLSNGVRKVKKAVALIGRFYDEYVGSPLGASQQRTEREARARAQANAKRGKTEGERGLVVSHRATEWLQSLVPAGDLSAAEHSAAVLRSIEDAQVLSPFAAAVLGGFVRDLSALDTDLYAIGQYLQDPANRARIHEYWKQGTYRSASFLSRAAAFLDTVQTEITRARAEMSCCRKMYTSSVTAGGALGKYPHRRTSKAQPLQVGADGKAVASPSSTHSDSSDGVWTMWMYIGLVFCALGVMACAAWAWTKSQDKQSTRVAVRPGAHTSAYAPPSGLAASTGSLNAADTHPYTQPLSAAGAALSNPYMAAAEPAPTAQSTPAFGRGFAPLTSPSAQQLLGTSPTSPASSPSPSDAAAPGFAAYLQQDAPPRSQPSALPSTRPMPSAARSLPAAPSHAPFSPPHNPFAPSAPTGSTPASAPTPTFAPAPTPTPTLPPASAPSSAPSLPAFPQFPSSAPRSPLTFPSLPSFASPARATQAATPAAFAPRSTLQPLALPPTPASSTPTTASTFSLAPSRASPFPTIPNVPLSTAHANYSSPSTNTLPTRSPIALPTFPGASATARTTPVFPTFPGASPVANANGMPAPAPAPTFNAGARSPFGVLPGATQKKE